MKRRQFISLTSSSLLLAGCLREPPSPAPDAVDAIDAHFHLFNATDTHVGEYVLKGKSLFPNRKLREAIARFITDKLSAWAPSARYEFNQLTSARRAGRSLDDALDSDYQDTVDLMRDAIFPNSELKTAIDDEMNRFGIRGALTEEDFNRVASGQTMRAEFTPDARRDLCEGFLLDPREFLSFLFVAGSGRYRSLQKRYRRKLNSQSVRTIGVAGALVDFDYWLADGRKPVSSLEDQQQLHELISVISAGYYRPLMAYNPMTDVKEKGRSRERVLSACKFHGFVGAKLYPPMGFYPAGNKGELCSELNDALEQFFGRCAEEGIPVMPHSHSSQSPEDKFNDASKPSAWSKALTLAKEKYGDALFVNLGHFGGDEFNQNAPDQPNSVCAGPAGASCNWTAEFSELMATEKGKNVFADLGYADRLSFSCEAPIEKLRQAFTTAEGLGFDLSDRILYGTDWYMIAKDYQWAKYPERIFTVLKQKFSLTEKQMENVFRGNANRVFGSGNAKLHSHWKKWANSRGVGDSWQKV